MFSTYQVLCSLKNEGRRRPSTFGAWASWGRARRGKVEARDEGPGGRTNGSHGLLPLVSPQVPRGAATRIGNRLARQHVPLLFHGKFRDRMSVCTSCCFASRRLCLGLFSRLLGQGTCAQGCLWLGVLRSPNTLVLRYRWQGMSSRAGGSRRVRSRVLWIYSQAAGPFTS